MKKKIAIYNGQLYMGGIERVLVNYLEKLALEPELDITLIIKENIPEKNVFASEVPKNIKVEYIKSEELCRRTDSYRKNKKNTISRLMYQWSLFYERVVTRKWVKEYFEKNRFDVIVDFDMSLMKYVDEIKNQDIITWAHFTLKGKKKKRQEMYKTKFKRYRNIVLICDDMKTEFEEMYPEFKEKGIRIYNPMDFITILKKSEDIKELSKEELDLLKENYFIGVSRLVGGKNRVAMVEIYSELKKRGRKEKLYILGDGPDRENIEKKIKELNLEKDVLLLGQKKNPFPWMKNAKLFLHTSMGEGFGLVLVEAMVCDTIVVAYDCPTGPREILVDGKAGGLIALNDKKAFEDKVMEILENEVLQKSIKEEMYKKMDEFTYEYIRKDLLNVLK
ncbi:glycosyltransferase [Cetobacterium sp. 8H]|uniref:glycosyltransferase n=1 Tax=Cetobacterium sp. 8H TaxID=2759681 RepID=UPI00163BB706|nr:glycosyltransferase [Cetobacterium sp. 8H]MBC2850958.1 glycosyltransferase [Cetobacterium sp. 8H]